MSIAIGWEGYRDGSKISKKLITSCCKSHQDNLHGPHEGLPLHATNNLLATQVGLPRVLHVSLHARKSIS